MEPPEFFRCQIETIGSIVQISPRIISLFRILLCWKAFPEAGENSAGADLAFFESGGRTRILISAR